MIKLYKRDNGSTRYWEAWKGKGKVIIHWGIVGDRGESREVDIEPGMDASELIKSESKAPRSEGFSRLSDEKHACFVIQYKTEGWGSEDDLSKRARVEEIMNETLGWTGNGVCDGGDIGSGTINVFCYVVDPILAKEAAVAALNQKSLLDGAIIGTRGSDEEQFHVLWPENSHGDITLMDENLD